MSPDLLFKYIWNFGLSISLLFWLNMFVAWFFGFLDDDSDDDEDDEL